MRVDVHHASAAELEAGLQAILDSPADDGVLKLIVRRPSVGTREVVTVGHLDLDSGLVGDSWRHRRGPRHRPEPHPDTQLNVMNARAIALIAREEHR